MNPRLVLPILVGLAGCPTGPKNPPPAALSPTAAPVTEQQRNLAEVVAQGTIAATGDLLMHETVKQSAVAANTTDDSGQTTNHDGFDALFESIAPIVRDADLAFANLETPVAPKTGRGTRSKVFNVSASLLPALDNAGFDLLSFANNHVYDQGRRGFRESLEHLNASRLDAVGAATSCADAKKARIVDVNGIRIAVLAATTVFNDAENSDKHGTCASFFDEQQTIEDVKQLREEGAEIVMLSLHWGREYRSKPRPSQVDIAHRLMEAGVDVILGHHPHVLQPVEVYKTKDHRVAVTFYSLGNAISNQSAWYQYGIHDAEHGNPRDGVIALFDVARIEYAKSTSSPKHTRTEILNLRLVPTWTLNETRTDGESETPYIRVVPLHELVRKTATELSRTTDEETEIRLMKNLSLYNDRLNAIQTVVGEGLLMASPKP